jgi:hypothetical protein
MVGYGAAIAQLRQEVTVHGSGFGLCASDAGRAADRIPSLEEMVP